MLPITFKEKIEELLTQEYFCSLAELQKKGTVYTVNTKTEKPFIKILAYKNCVLVCTSEKLQERIQTILRGKNRDEIFELPYVYGQTIHYIPGGSDVGECSLSSDYSCEFLWKNEIMSLRGLKGFENSLAFEEDGTTSTGAVYIAKDHGKIMGVAGAAESSVKGLWEIGVDVSEEYRDAGLGTALVSNLTRELLARNIIPFYSASVTNIGSQRVAGRCGYIPMWVDTYGTTLDGSSVYNDIL